MIVEVGAPSRFGVFVKMPNSSAQTQSVAWFSPSGDLLLHCSWGVDEHFTFDTSSSFFLNNRQLVLVTWGRSKQFRLLTLGTDGGFTVRKFLFSSTQDAFIGYGGFVPTDLTGFYYTDTATWTLSRVDFPKPESGSKTIELQSADQPTGPWKTVEQTSVPSEDRQEFFRLNIKE